jgi:hypothetical protein
MINFVMWIRYMGCHSFSSRLASNKIITHGYRVLTFIKCTIIIIIMLMITSGLESSFG